jgi:N-acyl-phosphatidylethanolamine-hydrolysing phospholipase D
MKARAAASLALLLLSLCCVPPLQAQGNPYYDPAKPHHTPSGFRNNDIGQVDKPPASPVQFAGPRRAQPPGIAMAQLPPIDVVVISHNHYDHLDRDSVVRLAERAPGKTLFLAPLGLKTWLEEQGVREVVELDWWDAHLHRGVEFRLVPVQHWSSRSLGDRNRTLWGGWAVFAPDLHWYFSGDSGYSRDFADARERFASRQPDGFDLAVLAIGAYEPRWFMQAQHMNPAEAMQAHNDLGARRSLGIHWGTFNLTDEALDQPPRDLVRARQAQGVGEQDFFVLGIGETRRLEPRKPRQSQP